MTKMDKFKRMIPVLVMSLIALPIILFVIPKIGENRLKKEAPVFIKANGLEVVGEYGDYSRMYAQQDFIIKRESGKVDTIGVANNNGQLIITSTLEQKKDLLPL